MEAETGLCGQDGFDWSQVGPLLTVKCGLCHGPQCPKGPPREVPLPCSFPPDASQKFPEPSQVGAYVFKCLQPHQCEKLVMIENLISFRTRFVPLAVACEFIGRLLMPESMVFVLRSPFDELHLRVEMISKLSSRSAPPPVD